MALIQMDKIKSSSYNMFFKFYLSQRSFHKLPKNSYQPLERHSNNEMTTTEKACSCQITSALFQ